MGTMPGNIGINKSEQFTATYTNSTQYIFLCECLMLALLLPLMVSVLDSQINYHNYVEFTRKRTFNLYHINDDYINIILHLWLSTI